MLMIAYLKNSAFAALSLATWLWLACGTSALAVPPMPGFGSLNPATTASPFAAFESPGADIALNQAKLYGGANGPFNNTAASVEWIVDLAMAAGAGHSISGTYDYSTRVDLGYLVSLVELQIDPDGSGALPYQTVFSNPGQGVFSGSIPTIALPLGATQIGVLISATGSEAAIHVPNNSIDLFYAIPEPSGFVLASLSAAAFAVWRRKRK
jgi:hypothetical protein